MDARKTLKDLMNENIMEDDFKEEIVEIDISKIKPNPYQPRYNFSEDSINELAESIKEHGLISPIVVKDMNGYYAIIAGERRFRACLKLGMKTISAIVRQYEKSKMIELALIENIQREDLSAIEEAKALEQIVRELNLTQAEVAEKIGKTRSYVTNMLGLLTLPDEVLSLVDLKKLSMSHARALSKLEDRDKIIKLANDIVNNNLSVRDIEELAKTEEKKKAQRKGVKTRLFSDEAKYLSEKYNANFDIKSDKSVLIKVKNKDELQKLLNKLKGE